MIFCFVCCCCCCCFSQNYAKHKWNRSCVNYLIFFLMLFLCVNKGTHKVIEKTNLTHFKRKYRGKQKLLIKKRCLKFRLLLVVLVFFVFFFLFCFFCFFPFSITKCPLALWLDFNIVCEEEYRQGRPWSVLLIILHEKTKSVTHELK